MKKKQILLQRSAVLLAGVILAAGACACGADNSAPAGQEAFDDGDTTESAETDTETEEQQTEDTADAGEEADTGVTSDAASGETQNNPVTVTFEKTSDEIKGDDGKVIFTNSVQMPVVSIEGAADIAEKINADIREYFDTFSYDETLSMAKEDYAASLGEDGWDFLGYSTEISTQVTRMDDAVVSFRITSYDFTGGAHGNYGSTGRNYSTKTGELLTFGEIAEDSESFHATVLDYMVNLAETPSYKDKLFESPSKTALEDTLFCTDGWLFSLSGIDLLAAPYALGPYASGEIHFILPYEKANDLGLKEEYRYSGKFVEEHYYIYNYDSQSEEQAADRTSDYAFDLDGDGTDEEIAFYSSSTDPDTGASKNTLYINGEDYGKVIDDALQDLPENSYPESTYALYHADTPDGEMPAIAVLMTEYSSEENNDRHPYSYLFGYTKDKGLYYMYQEDGYVTLPAQP